jgi:hypothetical protein
MCVCINKIQKKNQFGKFKAKTKTSFYFRLILQVSFKNVYKKKESLI